MKLLATLLALLGSVALAIPATFDIWWNFNPASDGVTGYNIYSGPTNAPARIVSVGSTNSVQLTMADGVYRLTITSTNAVDESPPSVPLYLVVDGTNVIAITKRPGAPLNIQLR